MGESLSIVFKGGHIKVRPLRKALLRTSKCSGSLFENSATPLVCAEAAAEFTA